MAKYVLMVEKTEDGSISVQQENELEKFELLGVLTHVTHILNMDLDMSMKEQSAAVEDLANEALKNSKE